jgi:tetratricopeptide (TPR) repeat protein
MFKAPMQPVKSNLACGSPFNSVKLTPARSKKNRALIGALAAIVCLYGSSIAVGAAAPKSAQISDQPTAERKAGSGPGSKGARPSQRELDAVLAKASTWMEQAKYQEAIETLQPFSGCDPRVSLLLAAAFEENRDLDRAEETLRKAHSTWPSNNSIAASLARQYYGAGRVDKALEALAHFHPTATTSLQEMELSVVVFLAGNHLAPAQVVAETAYKNHPSVHSLLMLANVLQLEGKFKDVIHLLGDERSKYQDSPEFLITLAESEFDGILYDAARTDLERAISLDPTLYQGHFLLGNVLAKLGEIDEAVGEYRFTITLSPDQPRAYYQLALVLQAKQDKDGAKQELAKALAVDGHYAPARVEMGRLLLGQSRFSEAVDQLTLAVKDNPSSEQAYFLLAKAYAGLGEKDKSDEMARRLVAVRNANWKGSASEDTNRASVNRATGP